MTRTIAFALSLACAGCVTSTTPPPPPPPPPGFALTAGQAIPAPEEDMALIRSYEAKTGFRYTDREIRSGLLTMFARRVEATHFKGYSMAWADDAHVFVNMKPPFDRAALLNMAAPELRPALQIRAVRFDAAEIAATQAKIGEVLKPITAGWAVTYDYRTDRFEANVPPTEIATALRLLPPDLSDYTDVREGEIIPVGQSVTNQPIKGQR